MELTGTIPALLSPNAAAKGNETILRKKDRGIWNTITWSDLASRVKDIGQGLRAAGVTAGEAVAILCDTRPELVYADLAILSLGGVSVAIDPEDEAPRVSDILTRTNAVAAIVQGEEQLDKILSIRTACPELRRIVIIDMKGLREFRDPQCISLTDLIDSGAGGAAGVPVTADQAAVILVPRTGDFQTLTHGDIMRRISEAASSLGVHAGDERLAVLPMCDPAERIFGLYLSLAAGVISDYLENPETATENSTGGPWAAAVSPVCSCFPRSGPNWALAVCASRLSAMANCRPKSANGRRSSA